MYAGRPAGCSLLNPSGAAEADIYDAAFDHHRDTAGPLGDGEHLLHVLRGRLYIHIYDFEAFFRVILTGRVGVRSGVFTVYNDLLAHVLPPLAKVTALAHMMLESYSIGK